MIALLPFDFDYDSAALVLAGGAMILLAGICIGLLIRALPAKLDPQPVKVSKVDATDRTEFWKRGLEPALLLYWRRRDAVKGVK